MEILIIEDIASSEFGGAERTMRSYCEYLARNHRLHFVYDRPGDYAQGQSQIYASVNRISVSQLRAQPTLSWVREVVKLVCLCKKQNIDLILTHVIHSVSMLRVVRMLTGTKVVVLFKWVCSTEGVGLQATWGLKGLDCGISVSRFVASYWIKNGFSKERMHIVPEGVALDGELPSDDPWQLPVERDDRAVGFAGRIVPEKGLHILIDAIARLSNQGARVECFVAGSFEPGDDGPLHRYHASIKKQIDDLGIKPKVHFLGYVKHLGGFLKKMDAVVIPSICQEAQPMVLMESMAAGTPVVASRVGGVPEVLTNTLAKWIFRPDDVDDLCSKLTEVLELATTERVRLADALRQRAVAEYSIQECHKRLSEVIRSVHDGWGAAARRAI